MQDPDVVAKELHTLLLRSGSRLSDAIFGPIMESVLDPVELEKQRYRRHMFLARWGRQPVTQWADVDGREVRRYVSILSDMLREEHAAAKQAVEDARTKSE